MPTPEDNIRRLRRPRKEERTPYEEMGVNDPVLKSYNTSMLGNASPLTHSNEGGVYRDRITARVNDRGLNQNVTQPYPHKSLQINPKTGELELVEPRRPKDKDT